MRLIQVGGMSPKRTSLISMTVSCAGAATKMALPISQIQSGSNDWNIIGSGSTSPSRGCRICISEPLPERPRILGHDVIVDALDGGRSRPAIGPVQGGAGLVNIERHAQVLVAVVARRGRHIRRY